jgi:hypothetical protein
MTLTVGAALGPALWHDAGSAQTLTVLNHAVLYRAGAVVGTLRKIAHPACCDAIDRNECEPVVLYWLETETLHRAARDPQALFSGLD